MSYIQLSLKVWISAVKMAIEKSTKNFDFKNNGNFQFLDDNNITCTYLLQYFSCLYQNIQLLLYCLHICKAVAALKLRSLPLQYK